MDRGGQPALTCESCGAATPLDRAIKLGPTRRQLTCQECGVVAEWSIEQPGVIDLRDSATDEAHDDVEAPGSTGRGRRE